MPFGPTAERRNPMVYTVRAMLRTVRATRYVTPLREGGSLPAIIEADDLGLYVLKFRGAGQGPLGKKRARRRNPRPPSFERWPEPRARLSSGLHDVQPRSSGYRRCATRVPGRVVR